jgi:hypothetical protein
VEGLLRNAVPLTTSFEFGFLNGIPLKEVVELRRISPAAFIVVVLDLAGFGLTNDGVLPSREMNA